MFSSGHQAHQVDIVMIGHFARDLLVVGGQGTVSSGGAVYYGGIALARLGHRVAVVTRLAAEDFGRLDELREEGILVFAQPAEQTSGIENVYFTADMDRRLCKPLGFAGPFRREDIPDIEAKVFLVGPIMAGEVDLPLVEALAQRGRLALDVQGFVRVRRGDDLVFEDWPEKEEGLACVDVLKLDSAEAEVLTGQADMHRAVEELAALGPQEIVLTHAGGVLVYAGDRAYEAPFRPRQIAGRTGRGDTCFAAYLGRRLSAPPQEACRFAAAVTSLKMEKPGPFKGSRQEVEQYLAAYP
ncbi:MAG: PfkB family carbohydrate kinase [Anaerolineae bacterium]|nr:PfkB family carbohydrate kinase [Anaerolineae bacterium]